MAKALRDKISKIENIKSFEVSPYVLLLCLVLSQMLIHYLVVAI